MDRTARPSDLCRPGLYFTCKCCLSGCTSRNRRVLYYIGVGGDIDFVEAWKECKCESCENPVGSVSTVGFFRCRWSYGGTVQAGEEVREDWHYTSGFTVCVGPKRFRWKELRLSAWELTKEEVAAAHECALAALDTPLGPQKRGREERKDPVERREVDSQTTLTSFPTEGAEKMSQSLVLSDQLLKQLKSTVKSKEERYHSLQSQVNALQTDISALLSALK